MRILVICQYYHPEQFRITEICEGLVRRGHAVTVLTGLPNYPSGRITAGYRWHRRRDEVIRGVRVVRCAEIGRRPGSIGLFMNYLSYMLSASVRTLVLHRAIDVVFVYQLSPVTMGVPGVLLSHRSRRPLYLYCCDIWPESVKALLPGEGSIWFRGANAISRYVYGNCDRVAVSSAPFIDYMVEQHGLEPDRITYIPTHSEDPGPVAGRAHQPGTASFVFTGNVGLVQDLDCIIDAVKELRDLDGVHVHIVGGGSYLDAAMARVSRESLDHMMTFYGHRPVEEMSRYYEMSDACIVTLKPGSLVSHTLPSKLPAYMAAGRPVIGAIDGAARQVIEEAGCGLVVGAGDAHALASAMRHFADHPVNYAECGSRARAYFEAHFTLEQYLDSLIADIEGLLDSKGISEQEGGADDS